MVVGAVERPGYRFGEEQTKRPDIEVNEKAVKLTQYALKDFKRHRRHIGYGRTCSGCSSSSST